jgi:hypothetical protein
MQAHSTKIQSPNPKVQRRFLSHTSLNAHISAMGVRMLRLAIVALLLSAAAAASVSQKASQNVKAATPLSAAWQPTVDVTRGLKVAATAQPSQTICNESVCVSEVSFFAVQDIALLHCFADTLALPSGRTQIYYLLGACTRTPTSRC